MSEFYTFLADSVLKNGRLLLCWSLFLAFGFCRRATFLDRDHHRKPLRRTPSPSAQNGSPLTDFRGCAVSLRRGVPPPVQRKLSLIPYTTSRRKELFSSRTVARCPVWPPVGRCICTSERAHIDQETRRKSLGEHIPCPSWDHRNRHKVTRKKTKPGNVFSRNGPTRFRFTATAAMSAQK